MKESLLRDAWVRRLLAFFGILMLAFSSGPLLVIIPMSFSSATGLQFPPPGFSLQWYRSLFHDERWISAVKLSLGLGAVVTLLTVVLGGLAAYGLTKSQGRSRALLLAFFLTPLIVPPIVTAVGLSMSFSRFEIRGTILGIVLGHVVIVVPYVVLLMVVAFQSFDFRLELMARSLGAGWARSFGTVVLPILAPTLVASSLIAFAVSLDEVIVTIFVSGSHDTVPTLMFNQLRDRIDPTVTALSTLLIVVTILLMLLAGWVMTRSTATRKAVGALMTNETE